MNFFELKDISEKYLELINPTSLEKVVSAGKYLGLKKGSNVIDFGAGYGEILTVWAEHFGIKGVGIDIRDEACRRAQRKFEEKGLEKRLKIFCQNGAEHKFKKKSYDAAVCIGATFIWDGYRNTIMAIKEAIKPGARLAVGEVFLTSPHTPKPEKTPHLFLTEPEILQITREEGFELIYILRSNRDDWDRYEAGNWYSLAMWLEDNPNHPDKRQVADHLREVQDEYVNFGMANYGWAIYILKEENR